MKKHIRNLQEGDLVDLEGDRYADPHHDNIAFECEYQEVAFVHPETPTCTCVGFEGWDWCGFPPDHEVEVVG